jgi:hypothetical protein
MATFLGGEGESLRSIALKLGPSLVTVERILDAAYAEQRGNTPEAALISSEPGGE